MIIREKTHLLCILILACVFFGCGTYDGSLENEQARAAAGEVSDSGSAAEQVLNLRIIERKPELHQVVIELTFNPRPTQKLPRVMEAMLNAGPLLTLVGFETGQALHDAGKQLVVQQKEGGIVRSVAFSAANVNSIEAGSLATYTFSYNPELAESARIEIMTDSPIFAPMAANDGLLVSDPLIISLD